MDGWIEVLNKFDDILKTIVSIHDDCFCVCDGKEWFDNNMNNMNVSACKGRKNVNKANARDYRDLGMDTMKCILSFTALLLANTCNKDRYNSVDVSSLCFYYSPSLFFISYLYYILLIW